MALSLLKHTPPGRHLQRSCPHLRPSHQRGTGSMIGAQRLWMNLTWGISGIGGGTLWKGHRAGGAHKLRLRSRDRKGRRVGRKGPGR
eukprot:scaffold87102_cov19-Tisochrysis_lutea.AAC.1